MEDRLGRWFDIVHDLLAEPLTVLPYVTLIDELVVTFGAKTASWVHRHDRDRVDCHMWAPGVKLEHDAMAWLEPRLDQHPLLRWFATTANPAAQTIGRVPKTLRDPRYAAWTDILGPLEVEHQMALPLTLQGQHHRAFVIVTHASDFSDEDLKLARRLQALLAGLDRQAQALARWMPCTPSNDAGLTARELAVLSLIAGGLTARAVARKLLISPRTVQKHLEHIYPKLRTSDRVSAVLRARALGLLNASERHGSELGSW